MTYLIGCKDNRFLRVNGMTAGPHPFEKGIIGDTALLGKMFPLIYQLQCAAIYVLYDSRNVYYAILISTKAFGVLCGYLIVGLPSVSLSASIVS